jgi:tRNA(fMet)-specific endonuclease VapC
VQIRYLLDTNICIYIRQKKPPEVMRHFERLKPGDAGISVITYGELIYGTEKSAHRSEAMRRLQDLVTVLPALPMPEGAANIYGKLGSELEARGEMIGNNDLWIAAHAITAQAILVTNDESEFRRVRGLRLQNWAKP